MVLGEAQSGNEALNRVLHRSLSDLRLLRMERDGREFTAAGLSGSLQGPSDFRTAGCQNSLPAPSEKKRARRRTVRGPTGGWNRVAVQKLLEAEDAA